MTDDADLDALCGDYLAKLSDSLAGLPPADRRQIIDQVSEHIATARSALPAQSEAAVRDILERLGTPEEIAASAAGEEGPRPPMRGRKPLLVGAGAVVVLIVVGVGLAALLGAFSSGGNGSVQSNLLPPQTSPSGSGSTTTPAGVVIVPSLAGQNVSAAVQQLVTTGLSYTLTYVSGTEPVGTVVEQSPAGGSRVEPTTQVRLTVTGTQVSVTVPNVIGQSQAQAQAALSAAGLDVRFVTKTNGSAVPGTVTDQAPAAGSTVAQQSSVTLTVSQ